MEISNSAATSFSMSPSTNSSHTRICAGVSRDAIGSRSSPGTSRMMSRHVVSLRYRVALTAFLRNLVQCHTAHPSRAGCGNSAWPSQTSSMRRRCWRKRTTALGGVSPPPAHDCRWGVKLLRRRSRETNGDTTLWTGWGSDRDTIFASNLSVGEAGIQD